MEEDKIEIIVPKRYVKGAEERTAYKETGDAATRNDNVFEKLTEEQKRLLELNGYFIVRKPKIVTLIRDI